MTLTCEKCPSDTYSLQRGFVQVRSDRVIKRVKAKCKACPFGGQCTDGIIKSRGIFWGYRENLNVVFIICPEGYCCNPDKNCHGIDTCGKHRMGEYLCGNCKPGYHVDYFTNNCVLETDCKRKTWFWTIYLFHALCYSLIFGYFCLSSDQRFSLEIGLLKILLDFYQINMLIHVSVPGSTTHGRIRFIDHISKALFTLKLDIEFFSQTFCPMIGLDTINKYFIKYILFVFVTLFMPLIALIFVKIRACLLYTSPSPRDS